MNKILFVLFFLGLNIFGNAQNSITGKIQNTKNEPLYGVEVFAPDLHIGTITDENGIYELNNLPIGEIRIVFSFIGFKEVYKTINLTNQQSIKS